MKCRAFLCNDWWDCRKSPPFSLSVASWKKWGIVDRHTIYLLQWQTPVYHYQFYSPMLFSPLFLLLFHKKKIKFSYLPSRGLLTWLLTIDFFFCFISSNLRKEFTPIVLKLIRQTKHINYVPKDWSSWGRGPINYSCFPYLGWFDVLGLSSYQVSFRHSIALAYNSQHYTKLGLRKIYQQMIPQQ